MRWNSPTFFSRCGEILSKTELKLCNGELPFRSFRLLGLDRLLLSDSFRPFLIISRGGVIRGEFDCLTGEPSLFVGRVKKPSVVFIGDIVRSGDNVIRCVISLIGDVGESTFCDLARVSAIKRRACSRRRAWRSSCSFFVVCSMYLQYKKTVVDGRDDDTMTEQRRAGINAEKEQIFCYKTKQNQRKQILLLCYLHLNLLCHYQALHCSYY